MSARPSDLAWARDLHAMLDNELNRLYEELESEMTMEVFNYKQLANKEREIDRLKREIEYIRNRRSIAEAKLATQEVLEEARRKKRAEQDRRDEQERAEKAERKRRREESPTWREAVQDLKADLRHEAQEERRRQREEYARNFPR